MKTINTVKQTFFTQMTRRYIVLSMVVTLVLLGQGIGLAEDAATIKSAKDQRGAELDTKISDIGIEWRRLRRKLRAAGGQAKTNLEADAGETKIKLSNLLEARRGVYRSQFDDVKQELDSAWQELKAAGSEAETEISADLEQLRVDWQAKYEQLRDSHDQYVEQLRDELARLEKEAAVAAEDWSVEMADQRASIRADYERESNKLRATYQEFIAAAQQEVDRLRTAAANAQADAKTRMSAAADRLSQQLNVEYDKLRDYYQETVAKAHDYFDDSERQLKTAKVEVASKIEAERFAAAKWMSGLYEEMTASYEAYQTELDKQIASLEQRSSQADAETKAKLNAMKSKLEAKRALVSKELEDDYQAAVAALEGEIARLESEAQGASTEGRAKTVEAIEYLQAKLETAKKKLQSD
jgi:hypothetical protein